MCGVCVLSLFCYVVFKVLSNFAIKRVGCFIESLFQLNKANTSDTEAAFLDLHLSISKAIASTKIYDKRDDFDFEIVNFPF